LKILIDKLFLLILIVIFSSILYNCTSSLKSSKDDKLQTRKEFKSGNFNKIGIEALLSRAEYSLNNNYKSVVDKKVIPPSGDMHDYLSRAVYFWPDSSKVDGLPWIYKDGKYNFKSFEETDHKYYYQVMGAIRDLSLLYFYTNDPKYALKTSELIKFWFINDSTQMNPNFNFAQGIPGRTTGTPSGIIDSRAILWVIEAISFIRKSEIFTQQDEHLFKDWCNQYLIWLIDSDLGKKESEAPNNHGTFYDIQVAKFADYLHNEEIVRETLERVKKKRIETQILPDGSMPLELDRAEGFTYSVFQLSAYFELAKLGEKYSVNLWDYKGEKSGSIKDAYYFILNNAILSNNWKYKGKIDYNYFLGIMNTASEKFDPNLEKTILRIEKSKPTPKLTDLYFIY